MVATDGRVHDACANVCAKRMPSAASASICGVLMAPVAVARQVVGAQRVDHDQDHVGRARRRRRGPRRRPAPDGAGRTAAASTQSAANAAPAQRPHRVGSAARAARRPRAARATRERRRDRRDAAQPAAPRFGSGPGGACSRKTSRMIAEAADDEPERAADAAERQPEPIRAQHGGHDARPESAERADERRRRPNAQPTGGQLARAVRADTMRRAPRWRRRRLPRAIRRRLPPR